MLILTRKKSESIIIGDREITVTILDNRNGQVKLGVIAPSNVPVHREEIYNKIQEKKEQGQ